MSQPIEDITFENLPEDDRYWTVIEHGAVRWNNDAEDEPTIDIAFCELSSGNVMIRRFAKSFSIYLYRGSVWLNGAFYGERTDLETVTFDFDYHDLQETKYITAYSKEFELKSILDLPSDGLEYTKWYAIPKSKYPIPKQLSATQYLPLMTHDGIELIVSCLTVFDAMYGHGQHTRKALFHNYADKALEKLEFTGYDITEFKQPPAQDEYEIGLKRDVLDADAPLLYGLKEINSLALSVNSITQQLHHNGDDDGKYLTVRPWFEGEHKWQVTGLWLRRGERFLALRIDKFQYPPLPTLYVVRENRNQTAEKKNPGAGTRQIPLKDTDKKPKNKNQGKSSPRSRGAKLVAGDAHMWQEPTVRKPEPKGSEESTGNSSGDPEKLKEVSPSDMRNGKSNAAKVELDRSKDRPEPPKYTEQEEKLALDAINLIGKALEIIRLRSQYQVSVKVMSNRSGWVNANGSVPWLLDFGNKWSWCLNKKRAVSDDINACPRRRYAVYKLDIDNQQYYFFGIERFKNNSFRTGLLYYSSEESLCAALPAIEEQLADKKGVWNKIDHSQVSLKDTIIHGKRPLATAKQILRKLGLKETLSDGGK